MTNVYKIELFVVDHDDIGADDIKETLENTRYPNRCISPHVINIEGRDIGDWDDSNPLNYTTTQKQELARLFSQWQPITTAPRDGTRILLFYGDANAVFTAWYDKQYDYSYTGIIDSIPQEISMYKYWHIASVDDDFPSYFDTENPINCYWQPMMELPV